MSKKNASVTLEYPVKLPDRVLTEVTMRRPTVGDHLANPVRDEQDLQGEFQLMCVLCELTPEDMGQIDVSDYDRLRAQYVLFRTGSAKPRQSPAEKSVAAQPAVGAAGSV